MFRQRPLCSLRSRRPTLELRRDLSACPRVEFKRRKGGLAGCYAAPQPVTRFSRARTAALKTAFSATTHTFSLARVTAV